MGLSLAGFDPVAVLEWDRWATDTLRENRDRGFPLLSDWPIHRGDVRDFDYKALVDSVDLVSGGPPCQPFSMGGKHRAFDDHRDMFPAAVEVIRQLRPRAFVLENVKGLTRSAFANYLQYIRFQLERPEIVRRADENWSDHHARLQREHTSGAAGLTYNVTQTLVNAANYGVPQKRERLFLIGFRSDLGVEWSFPEPTHTHDALLYDQFVTGEYWDRHRIAGSQRDTPPALVARVRALQQRNYFEERKAAWRTVRDALDGLPEPDTKKEADGWFNHRAQPGARSYPGHTGSPLDLPAKTLKAGDHGVPGGENMMVRSDGSVRYFTVRESARLQTFPDTFVLHGGWSEAMRQLGNAVPVNLAHVVGASVAAQLAHARQAELIALSRASGRGQA
jgi:DNA (cytosine-5)-methyltransferase 1